MYLFNRLERPALPLSGLLALLAAARLAMDAYSICHTSPSRRNSSRIYRDLRSTRPPSFDCDQLLRTMGAANASPQVVTCPWSAAPLSAHAVSEPVAKPHVAVVGAGLAGLRCADMLLHHGFRVTVIEARSRIGGRLHQEMLPNGHLVDVGPNWIHGTSDNPMYHLASQTQDGRRSLGQRLHRL